MNDRIDQADTYGPMTLGVNTSHKQKRDNHCLVFQQTPQKTKSLVYPKP